MKEIEDQSGEPTVVFPEGFHWGLCYTKVSHLISKQTVVFDAPCRGVPTRDNVQLNLDVAVTFRITDDAELVKVFAKEVKPSDLRVRLLSAVDQSVKSIARAIDHTQAYGLRALDDGDHVISEAMSRDDASTGAEEEKSQEGVGEHTFTGSYEQTELSAARVASAMGTGITKGMKDELYAQFKSSGIEILDVSIKNVEYDNFDIQRQLEARTMAISKRDEQKMDQQRTVLEISNNEELETLKQKLGEDLAKVQQEGEKMVNEVKVRLDKLRTEHHKFLENVRKKRQVQVAKIAADQKLRLVNSQQAVSATVEEFRSRAEADAQKYSSETSLEVEQILAKANLETEKNRAQAAMLISGAEGQTARMLQAKRQFETEKRQLKVYEALAANESVVLAASKNEDINALLLADEILESNASKPVNRQTVLAEMMVQAKGSKPMMVAGNLS